MSRSADALVGILARDRPEALEACLRGLERAGAPARIVLHLDAPEPGVRAIAEASGHEVLVAETQVGIGASLNRILALREPGQHFCRLDGDTEVETEGWLALLLEDLRRWPVVGAVLRDWEGEWTRKAPPGDRVIPIVLGRGIGSLFLAHSDLMDRLGGFRLGHPYGLEDTDFFNRVRRAGLRAGMDLRVATREAAAPTRKLWRIEGVAMSEEFAEARRGYFSEERTIHRPIEAPMLRGVGTDLQGSPQPMSERELGIAETIAHGTHSEALAWAAGWAGPGAVLEIGSGWLSTPWLHGWCAAQGRWLLTIETEDTWFAEMRALFGSTRHEFLWLERGQIEPPEEHWALVLVDGINEDRAAWLERLAGAEKTLVVVHDTEPSRTKGEYPEVPAALKLFEHRTDFTRVFPHTAVVWNGP